MKIKITNYPYQDHPVGDICDFGEELNTSLVGMGRAVWYTNTPGPIKQIIDNIEEDIEQITAPKSEAPKKKSTKFLNNQLRETIQEKQEPETQPEVQPEPQPESQPESQPEEPKKKRASWRR